MVPFKNWLGIVPARRIAAALTRAYPSFQKRRFLQGLENALEPLALKERSLHLKTRLLRELPEDPKKMFPLLVRALKAGPADTVGLSQFEVWPLTQIVAEQGLQYHEASMRALHAMTQVFTGEFAIRPFLIRDEARTLKVLTAWTRDPNEHVRRLVSEGSRPLLPWGERLSNFVAQPEKTWPLLEALKNDPSAYVRKSVANHINDHSKNHADAVAARLATWKKVSPDSTEIDWIIRHASRTLVKKGHPAGLALHGVGLHDFELLRWKIDAPRLRIGETLRLTVDVRNNSRVPATAIIDVVVELLGARGQSRHKVFKGRKLTLPGGASEKLRLSFPLRPVTVRAYYAGRQGCRILLNGRPSDRRTFTLMP